MKWISTNDQTPEEYMWVLVLAMNYEPSQPCPISLAMFRDDDWCFINDGFNNAVIHGDFWADIMASDITHWMPLPKLPEE